MAWLYLFLAGMLEIVWVYTMKQSDGFSRIWPTMITAIAALASFELLSLSMRTLPLGTAYTIWTGIGAIGAFAVGVLALGEQADAMRLTAAALIISGLVLMKISSSV